MLWWCAPGVHSLVPSTENEPIAQQGALTNGGSVWAGRRSRSLPRMYLRRSSSESAEYPTEEGVSNGRLCEGSWVPEQAGHALLPPGRVVLIYEVAQRIKANMLGERHCQRESAWLNARHPTHPAKGEAEQRAVHPVHREAYATPRGASGHCLAEQGDVRVVAPEQPLVERLNDAPNESRDGSGHGGSER
jgi:hypothetical protein